MQLQPIRARPVVKTMQALDANGKFTRSKLSALRAGRRSGDDFRAGKFLSAVLIEPIGCSFFMREVLARRGETENSTSALRITPYSHSCSYSKPKRRVESGKASRNRSADREALLPFFRDVHPESFRANRRAMRPRPRSRGCRTRRSWPNQGDFQFARHGFVLTRCSFHCYRI